MPSDPHPRRQLQGPARLYLVHDHDGRDLDMTHADKTLSHLRTLWGRDTYLLTTCAGRRP